jgi:hypothetical protein
MTRSLAAMERFLERLLERPAARLFGASPQPVQLQRRLERAMESGRVTEQGRMYVPDRYRVLLHPGDLAAFDGERTGLQTELANAVLRRARARGFRLVARPEVTIVPSARVPAGDFEVAADPLDGARVRSAAAGLRTVQPAGPRPPRRPISTAARIPPIEPSDADETPRSGSDADPRLSAGGFSVEPPPFVASAATPGPPMPVVAPASRLTALIEVHSGHDRPWAFVFHGGTVRVGRGRDNDLVLPDERVSRHHGRFTTRQGTLVYTDLASSNGSVVNGARVHEVALGVGDVLRLGDSTLTIRPAV